MAELFPIVAGLISGVAIIRLCTRYRVQVLVVTSISISIAAGLISGELAESLGYLLVDFLEALAAAVTGGLIGVAGARRAKTES